MTREELKKMYKDWMVGADETIKYSDFLVKCFDANLTDEEISLLEEETKKEP